MLFGEIFAVVLKDERIVLDPDDRFGRAGIVRVLQQFGDDVTRALNLLEQLPPRRGQNGIAFKLLPEFCRFLADRFKIGRAGVHPGASDFLSRCFSSNCCAVTPNAGSTSNGCQT